MRTADAINASPLSDEFKQLGNRNIDRVSIRELERDD